jgi:transposase
MLMEGDKRKKRARRSFTDEFKAAAVQQVVGEGRSVTEVAKSLELTRSALDAWVKQSLTDAGKGAPGALTTSEKEELAQLRRENRQLKMERDILKKATAFFAKESR